MDVPGRTSKLVLYRGLCLIMFLFIGLNRIRIGIRLKTFLLNYQIWCSPEVIFCQLPHPLTGDKEDIWL